MARFYVILVKGMFMPSFLCLMCYTPIIKMEEGYRDLSSPYNHFFNHPDFVLRKQSVW